MLELHFRCHKYKRYPKIKIHVDGDQLEEVHFSNDREVVKVPLSIIDGEHLLEIEHFGKTSDDTKFVNGKIEIDTKFEVTKVSIQDFDIPYTNLLACRFLPDWKNLHRPDNFPDVLKQSLIVGTNGTWSLAFATPIEDWIINQRRKLNRQNNVITYESYEIDPWSVIDYQLTAEDRKLIEEIKNLIS